jgi:hypothetical protein
MHNKYKGTCQCGNVTLALDLPNEITSYVPRACDCAYCIKRNVSYLSDPNGVLAIKSDKPLNKEMQGSEQAEFLVCNNCNLMIAVIYDFGLYVKGAVNASLLTDSDQLLTSVSVSPRLLSSAEKIERWNAVWLTISLN